MADELALLRPLQLGPFTLAHGIVLAPLTRNRAYGSVEQPQAALYYARRATVGGLLISEASTVNPAGNASGLENPGMWTQEQMDAWKPIVKAVHEKGAIFFCRLVHVGRVSNSILQPNGAKPVLSTNRAIQTGKLFALQESDRLPHSEPRALEMDEIPGILNEFVLAAKNAISARFNEVEIHGAHGYLIDQFLKSGVNDRNDKYGGSIENRARVALKIVDAVVNAVGADRGGIRLSPFAASIGEAVDSDPRALGVFLAEESSKRDILYIHYVEPRWNVLEEQETEHSLWPFRKAFKGVFFGAGGNTRENGNQAIEEGRIDAAVYGHLLLANPDMVERFKLNDPLNDHNRSTFYTQDPVLGYTDYPFLEESHPKFSPFHCERIELTI